MEKENLVIKTGYKAGNLKCKKMVIKTEKPELKSPSVKTFYYSEDTRFLVSVKKKRLSNKMTLPYLRRRGM